MGLVEEHYNTNKRTIVGTGRHHQDAVETQILGDDAIAHWNSRLADNAVSGVLGTTTADRYQIFYGPPHNITQYSLTPKVIYMPVIRERKTIDLNHTFIPAGAVVFPMPEGLTDGVAVTWEEKSAQARMLAGSVANVGTGKGGLISNMASSLEKGLAAVGAGQTSMVGSELSKQRGYILNTHEEQFFKGVDFRSWTFQHNMVASSEEESESMSNIVDFMQKWASPSYGASGTELKYPAEFRIFFMHGGKKNLNLPVINQCVCSEVTVAYNPQGINQFFESGASLGVDIGFQFKEGIIRTRDNIVSNETKASVAKASVGRAYSVFGKSIKSKNKISSKELTGS